MARFEDMMTELMHDVFEALADPDEILAVEANDEQLPVEAPKPEPEYEIQWPSGSTGKIKRYRIGQLSTSPARNIQLLQRALADIVTGNEGARAFAKHIIDNL